jgi:hypothetical protein
MELVLSSTRARFVRAFLSKLPTPTSAVPTAPTLIAAGLTVLLAQTCWPLIPAVTAVSFVALGATIVTIARLHRTALLRSGITIHLFVYASLYLIFIGAICDAATRGPNGGLTLVQTIDLGLSAGVMAFVARICVAAIIGGGDAPAR